MFDDEIDPTFFKTGRVDAVFKNSVKVKFNYLKFKILTMEPGSSKNSDHETRVFFLTGRTTLYTFSEIYHNENLL